MKLVSFLVGLFGSFGVFLLAAQIDIVYGSPWWTVWFMIFGMMVVIFVGTLISWNPSEY